MHHMHSVSVAAVVVWQGAQAAEAEAAVELDSGMVVVLDLEVDAVCSAGGQFRQEAFEEFEGDSAALEIAVDGKGVDASGEASLAPAYEGDGLGDDLSSLDCDQEEVCGPAEEIAQLPGAELVSAEGLPLESGHSGEIGVASGTDHGYPRERSGRWVTEPGAPINTGAGKAPSGLATWKAVRTRRAEAGTWTAERLAGWRVYLRRRLTGR